MRDLIEVINSMISEIPKSEESLVASFEDLKQTIKYSAPELEQSNWFLCGDILEEAFPEYEKCNKWQKKVGDIFMDKAPSEKAIPSAQETPTTPSEDLSDMLFRVQSERDQLKESLERALAYPTVEAYESACKALSKRHDEIRELQSQLITANKVIEQCEEALELTKKEISIQSHPLFTSSAFEMWRFEVSKSLSTIQSLKLKGK